MPAEFVLLVDASAAELQTLSAHCAPLPVTSVSHVDLPAVVQNALPLAVIIDLVRMPRPVADWLLLRPGGLPFPAVVLVDDDGEAALSAWIEAGARHWARRGSATELRLVFDLLRNEAAAHETQERAQSRLQASSAALMRLARSPRVTGPDADVAIREVVRAAIKGLGATRAGVWLLDDARERLKLLDRYDVRDDSHVTHEPPLPPHQEYLRVMRAQRIVAVSDSQTDRRTREFAEKYFAPVDVRSNIDVALRLRGELVGVISVEQIGRRREWTEEDEVFAGVLGDVVSLALESAERFRAEVALRKSERKLSEIFTHTNDSIVLYRVSLDGSVFCEDINPAGEAATGVLRDEAIGLKPQDVLPALDEDEMQKHFQLCILTRMSTVVESRLVLPDGERLLSTALVPLLDEVGNVERIAAVSRDMTQVRSAAQIRRQLEIQLAELQKNEALARLATNLAADMGETLDVIATQLATLSERPEVPRQALEAMQRATRRGRQLTDDALTYARRRVPEKLRVNFTELLISTVARLQQSAAPQLKFEASGPVQWVLGESAQLKQAVTALLRHCIRLARDGAPVEISLGQQMVSAAMASSRPPLVEGRYVRLRFAFQGVALSAEEQTRLFEPFFVTNQDPESSGLGLAVAQTLIAAHEGTVFVESSPVVGTTFQVFVPIAPEVSVTPSYRLMLVDDHPGMARVSARLLETMGFRTSVFDNPHDALAEFKRQPDSFDAVLTDLSMPQMSGEQFTHALHEVRPGLPIILSSGRAGDLDATTLESLGVAGVLVKPWRIDEAVATLNRALKPG